VTQNVEDWADLIWGPPPAVCLGHRYQACCVVHCTVEPCYPTPAYSRYGGSVISGVRDCVCLSAFVSAL